ncbi:antitoxin VapB family protein [Natronobiforma cellulositropha]|uniref:antitoxin VapB family protein n=1 Tax=Natronobiforma cellulositropha TaxID=1679076 RepID=UPI0021D5B9AF|nr:antitoxin VapB family protein [Natronobiforma cellulositropha]
MGSKTISLHEETYRRLDREKRADESFSDVVDRLLTGETENPLRELIGLVDEEELERVRHHSDAFREDVDARFSDRDDAPVEE